MTSRRHYVYIVTCSDGTLYTGYTTEVARRLREHNMGRGSAYTRSRRPVSLSYVEVRRSRSAALRRELEIKRMSRSGKLLLISRHARPPAQSPG